MLVIQCNPYQITNGIFHRIGTKKNLKICMETGKTPNSQSNLEKEKWSWRIRLPDFRLYHKAILQSSKQYGTDTKIEIQIHGIG